MAGIVDRYKNLRTLSNFFLYLTYINVGSIWLNIREYWLRAEV